VSKDATDALAAALCHLNSAKLMELILATQGRTQGARYRGQRRRRTLRNVLPKGTVDKLLAVARSQGHS
jgi:hypothetical protein